MAWHGLFIAPFHCCKRKIYFTDQCTERESVMQWERNLMALPLPSWSSATAILSEPLPVILFYLLIFKLGDKYDIGINFVRVASVFHICV